MAARVRECGRGCLSVWARVRECVGEDSECGRGCVSEGV